MVLQDSSAHPVDYPVVGTSPFEYLEVNRSLTEYQEEGASLVEHPLRMDQLQDGWDELVVMDKEQCLVVMGKEQHLVVMDKKPHLVVMGKEQQLVVKGTEQHLVVLDKEEHLVELGREQRVVVLGKKEHPVAWDKAVVGNFVVHTQDWIPHLCSLVDHPFPLSGFLRLAVVLAVRCSVEEEDDYHFLLSAACSLPSLLPRHRYSSNRCRSV